MLSPASLLLPLLSVGVLGGIAPAPGRHPNVTSGDLLESDDYSGPTWNSRSAEGWPLPPWMRHDRTGHVVTTFVMHYGQHDRIVGVTNETLSVTKRRMAGGAADNSDEIWHIRAEDEQLRPFFANVLGLSPHQVTVVHMTYSKEESVKKILVKESVMKAAAIWDKLRKAIS